MRCYEIRRSLERFVRREVAPSVRKRIEGHLSGCESCRNELARLRKLDALLATAPLPGVPDGFAARVVERARRAAVPSSAYVSARRSSHETLGRRARIAAGWAGALTVGLLLGGYLGIQTWETAAPSALQQTDPLASSGLGQLV